MIYYDIDTTENEYNNFKGEVNSLIELKQVLLRNKSVPNLVGSLFVNDSTIWISAERELGIYIAITNEKGVYISLWDKNALSEEVDVWGDGLYISRGLFIPESLAWKSIEEYIAHKRLCTDITWITPEDIPEDGYCIY